MNSRYLFQLRKNNRAFCLKQGGYDNEIQNIQKSCYNVNRFIDYQGIELPEKIDYVITKTEPAINIIVVIILPNTEYLT